MDKLIPLNKGIHRDPSQNPIGELDMCVNLIPNGAELTNIGDMREVGIKLAAGDVYIGKIDYTSDSEIHFCHNTKCIKYLEVKIGTNVDFNSTETKTEIVDVVSARIIGNCIVVNSIIMTYYYILKDGGLIEFSDALKTVEITFGLSGEEKVSDKDSFQWQGNFEDLGGFYAAFKPHLPPLIKAFVSKVEQEGKFVNPFFVRYAYRMYDNTTRFVSNPVLMPCCNRYGGVAYVNEEHSLVINKLPYHIGNSWIGCFAHDLYYTCIGDTSLGEFSSVISSIDVYISQAKFATENTAEPIGEYSNNNNPLKSYHGKFDSNGDLQEEFGWHEFSGTNSNITPASPEQNKYSCWTTAASGESIVNASVFYKLASIEPKSGVWTKIKGKDPSTLTDVLVEDYNGNYTTHSLCSFEYNNRFIRGNITRTLKLSYPFFKNVGCSYSSYRESPTEGVVYYHFNVLGKDVYTSENGYQMPSNSYVPYLFFPNRNLKEIVMYDGSSYQKISFTEHPFLSGSYAYKDMGNVYEYSQGTLNDSYQSLFQEKLRNAVQLSEVNSPFTFYPQNEVYVGDGEILGMSTASKAISEGQFGQYPIYVFCTDGIWSLGIADDGTIRDVSPVSRDVCNNPNSITQIDNAVVFSTEQGLKMISGGEVIMLSSSMHGRNVSESSFFTTEYFKNIDESYEDFDGLVKDETRDFREILKTCRIAYDYVNAQLRIYPEEVSEDEVSGEEVHKFYVYSLATGEFATSLYGGSLDAVIPSWPSTLLQIGGKVYDFANTNDSDTFKKGLLLTRPITLDDPFALKKLHDLRLKYTKRSDETYCKVMLFASNDEEHWVELRSLRGRPWKYFRIGVITNMTDDDRLSGMVLRYEVVRNNKLR